MAVIPIVEVKINKKEFLEIPEILHTKCEYVKNVKDPEIQKLIRDLIDTVSLPENAAAGLSAPQIGINKRVCVVRKFRPDPNNPDNEFVTTQVLVNPEITSFAPQTDIRWEGCLSIPGLFGMVERAKRAKVKAIDENGNPVKIKATGFHARVIQHELDHLDGVLYTDNLIGEIITERELDKLIEQEHKEL